MLYLKKCLLEIKDRLGPVTKELGLQHRLGKGHCDDLCLFFERTDADGLIWRAPVSFIFPPRSATGQKEITWEHVRLGLQETVAEPIGTNGWLSFVGYVELEGSPIEPGTRIPTLDSAFELAADHLQRFPLVPQDINVAGVVDDGDLADLWARLEDECRARGVERVDVGRNVDTDEFYSFHYEGSQVEIVYRGNEANFLIDGEIQAEVPKHELQKVMLELRSSFRFIEDKTSFSRDS
ncbi:hypothetical protein [Rhizobium johnstonii]|uniref:hypothetical protein n=1 Tax=Rhizobium johnstonii TaxID=3019933 RepID=UPI002DDD890F|nr:hypothetical protein U8P72_11505 [Rhizobium johnstonii]